MSCDAKIRPFRPVNETELNCELDEEHVTWSHFTVIRDYAYPGSVTEIVWEEEDRRTFRGDFIPCAAKGCILPLDHEGAHAR